MQIRENELLVVIDPQRDFTGADGFYAKRHSGINQVMRVRDDINRLLRTFDTARFVIIYSDYVPGQFGAGLHMCIPGTPGHEIDLDMYDTYIRMAKTEHSCFSSTEFERYLHEKNITRLLLCGFLAEHCVRQTATDALDKGYAVTLLDEYIGTSDDTQERKRQAFSELGQAGAIVRVFSA